MKRSPPSVVKPWLISVCMAAYGGILLGQQAPATQWDKIRETVKEENLREQAGQARPMTEQMVTMMRPLPEVRPSPTNSLYQKSIILFDGEMHTLIPVGSVLHLPSALRGRVVAEPKGDFTFWPNFLKRNSTWLAGKEVPLKMAQGDAKLASVVLKETTKSNQLLVSVYRQCPISVLEAKPMPAAPQSR